MINVPTNSNNLKAKVDDLDDDELKIVPRDLKKLSDVGDKIVKKQCTVN